MSESGSHTVALTRPPRTLLFLLCIIFSIASDRAAMLEPAESLTADRYGFVRIAPGEIPELNRAFSTLERFLYKGYRTKYGEPLIVVPSNVKAVHSFVGVRVGDDMSVQYLFNSDEFPESRWWDLNKRVLAFLKYLQTPK